MRILILNGPNLNWLGRREPEIYGKKSMEDYLDELECLFPDVELTYRQSNLEGELINIMQQAEEDGINGIILNAGGYTHTSVALHDCIKSLTTPVIEVHISNVHTREDFRRHSMLSPACQGVICGFGLRSYELAIRALM